MNHRAAHIGVPQPRVVFDRVEPDRDQHVSAGDQDVARLVAEQPDAPDEVLLQLARYHPGSLERLDHGKAGDREQVPQRRTRFRFAVADADQQHRLPRGQDPIGRVGDLPRRCSTQARHRRRLHDGGRARAGDHISGQHHRSRTARGRGGGADCVGDGFGHIVGMVDLAGVLGERLERGNGVHRLVCALESVDPADGTADRDHRVLFGVGGDQAGGQVGGARPRRHQCHAGGAGEPADCGGHEGRVLFVAAHHQLGTAVDQRVEDRVDLRPRHTKDVLNPVRGQRFHHSLGRTHFGCSHVSLLRSVGFARQHPRRPSRRGRIAVCAASSRANPS